MSFALDAYLCRIGVNGLRLPNLEVLHAIHLYHPQAITFGYLDPQRGEAIASSTVRLLREALIALGFELTGLTARDAGGPFTVRPQLHNDANIA